MKIIDNEASLAYHIFRSCSFDSIDIIGHVIVLRRGPCVMTVECPENDDARATVYAPGCPARVTTTNETDKIEQFWPAACGKETDEHANGARWAPLRCSKFAGHSGACSP